MLRYLRCDVFIDAKQMMRWVAFFANSAFGHAPIVRHSPVGVIRRAGRP
jgi:hypothetical protein